MQYATAQLKVHEMLQLDEENSPYYVWRIKEILVGSASTSSVSAANEFSKAITAYLIYVRLLVDRESLYRVSPPPSPFPPSCLVRRKMIKIYLRAQKTWGPKPMAYPAYRRNALHTLIAPAGVR